MESRSATPGRRLLLTGALVLLFFGYAIFLYSHLEAWAGGSDSSGYFNQANFLAQGKIHVPQTIPAGLNPQQFDWFTFVPLGFQPEPATNSIVPSYPLGLPLLLASAASIFSWDLAPTLVLLACALGGVALMLPLGRSAGLPQGWTWLGAFLLAASPLYTAMSLQFFSDVPATTAATAAVLSAWRSRSQSRLALIAGAFFSFAVLIRPSNAVLIAPIAVCLGLDWRRWLLLGLGGLPGAALQCGYNLLAYGGAFKSGYGNVDELFSSAWISPTLLHYAKWLPVLLTPVGIFALALPWSHLRDRFAHVLVAWFGAVLTFYVGYRHTTDDWWFLRFVLPAFPAAIVGGLMVLHRVWIKLAPASFLRQHAQALVAILTLAVLVHSVAWHQRLHATRTGSGEAMYHGAVDWAKTHLPSDAVLLASQCTGALAYHSRFPIVRWDLLDSARFQLVADACTRTGHPLHAMLFEHEEKSALAFQPTRGRWQRLYRERLISVWEWIPSGEL